MQPEGESPMSFATYVLSTIVVLLIFLVRYQYLIQRAALRIGEILYVMAGNVRAKAAEVRRDGKDVEIIEAHLFDIATSARSILRALGRTEDSLGPDPALTVSTNGSRMSADSLLRLADNIFFSVTEKQPDASFEDVQNAALERFLKKAPDMDSEAARKIVNVVAHQARKDAKQPTFAQARA
jgi:uncharacterized protein (DUF1786 family)